MTQARSDWVFDAKHYELLNAARSEAATKVISSLRNELGLKSALDLGCGLGHFTAMLGDFGLDVLGVDGREENVLEARRRYPHLRFEVADAQDPKLDSIGEFDLVFCYGLLYHLENPFVTIRSISKLARKLATVESVVYPSPEQVLVVLDENDCEDQSLNYVALYPSEASLAKMLSKSGLSKCYLPSKFPDHSAYRIGRNGFRQRTILFASRVSLAVDSLVPWSGTPTEFSPWAMAPLYPVPTVLSKLYSVVDRKIRGKNKRRPSK